MNAPRTWVALLLAAFVSPTAFGQGNLPAVDTLKKEVAKAVFQGIKGTKDDGDKAEQIRQLLAGCGSGCEPGLLIRQIGSWDAVANKLTFFDFLRKDPTYVQATPEEAVMRLNTRLTDFYERYKEEVIYKKSLDKEARQLILGIVNQSLPDAQPDSVLAGGQTSDSDASLTDSMDAEAPLEGEPVSGSITGTKPIPLWLLLAGTVGGLVLGVILTAAVMSRRTKALRVRWQQEVETWKRRSEKSAPPVKPVNTPNAPNPASEVIPLPKNVQNQLALLDQIKEEVGSLTDPLGAIRQLKSSAGSAPVEVAAVPVAPPPSAAEPPRMEVVYYPAPNEQGLFDDTQRSTVATPDSAYKLLIDSQVPTVARFRFEPEPGRMKRFLTYRTYFIDPACESENTFQEDSHSRIVTRREGSVTRENGVWRVQTKAVIRFE